MPYQRMKSRVIISVFLIFFFFTLNSFSQPGFPHRIRAQEKTESFPTSAFINDDEQIAWSESRKAGQTTVVHSYFYDDGSVIPVAKSLSDVVIVKAMNRKGNLLLEVYHDKSGEKRAAGYLYGEDGMIRLEQSENESCFPLSMNDLNDVAGYCVMDLPSRTETAYIWHATGKRVKLEGITLCSEKRPVTALINNKGAMAISDTTQAFFWEKGKTQKIEKVPSARKLHLTDMNEKGRIAGYYYEPYSGYRSFFWNSGIWNDIPHLEPGSMEYSSALNDSDQLIGNTFNDETFAEKPFLFEKGAIHDLSCGQKTSYADAINDKGIIAGVMADDTYDEHLIIWKDKTAHTLGKMMDRTFCFVNGINNKGHIVGYYQDTESKTYFLWEEGRFVDLTGLAALLP